MMAGEGLVSHLTAHVWVFPADTPPYSASMGKYFRRKRSTRSETNAVPLTSNAPPDRFAIVVDRFSIIVDRLSIIVDRFCIIVDRFSINVDRFSMIVASSHMRMPNPRAHRA